MKKQTKQNQRKMENKTIRNIISLLILVSLSIILLPLPVAAVPAPDHTTTLTQPDGDSFDAKLWGDQTNHGWETTNGYTIIKNNNTWYYAKLQDGLLKSTELEVTKHNPTGLKKHIRPKTENTKTSTGSLSSEASKSHNFACANTDFPNSGTIDIPVIAIDFADTNPTYTTGDIQNVFFGGQESFQDYYNEVSYGKFNPTGGSEGIAGWVQADHPHDYYGENNARGNDKRPGELVQEAILKADQQGFDFSIYDNNNNGCVQVMIVHQGTGEETVNINGKPSDIWSHRSSLSSRGTSNSDVSSVHVDGVVVDGYSIQPEIGTDDKITTIGIIAHEFGHLIGLPDLYDIDGSSEGIGEWGLMGTGSWLRQNRLGDTPAHLMAWSKWELGWIQPTKIPKSGYPGDLSPIENNQEVYQIFSNPNGPADWNTRFGGTGQYFLLEYRKKTGFDSELPGEGLAIWHIDESRTSNRDESQKLVDLEEADGQNDLDSGQNRGDFGDIFKNGSFNDSTDPNSKFYNGTNSGIEIKDIEIQQTVKFNKQGNLSCQILNKQDKYSITRNLSTQNTCIEVRADDITIEGNHNKITGNQNQGTAIYINNSDNVEIKNLSLSGLNTAVHYNDSNNGIIQNIKIENNRFGIKLNNTDNININKNTIQNNDYGLKLGNSNKNTITDNSFLNNNWGFWSKNSHRNSIQNLSLQKLSISSEKHRNIKLKQNNTQIQPPKNTTQIGGYIDIKDTNKPSYISLNLSYKDTNTQNVNESTLDLWRYIGSWKKLDTNLNTQQNNIHINITSNFSTFTILGNTTQDLISKYDTDNNGSIDGSEIRQAIRCFLFGGNSCIGNKLDGDQIREIIREFLFA